MASVIKIISVPGHKATNMSAGIMTYKTLSQRFSVVVVIKAKRAPIMPARREGIIIMEMIVNWTGVEKRFNSMVTPLKCLG